MARIPTDPLFGAWDNVFWAVADPANRLIIDHLALGDSAVGEISHVIDASSSNTSHRLSKLERLGLVSITKTKSGNLIYRLRPEALQPIKDWLQRFLP
ncbi:winged helix-turn-helix transcriptional regulator [Enterovirga sp. DB1703]|uniref:Winged helix-turn-helix transcriptional regulator n=2 Tax=Enterovirga aerilata TaxID=2730920 RepID=A0A849I7P4_9HYPH|nr:winged helix-turn-helix transcriptional regulator [Enterovirga sp. DB1703]